MSERHWRTVGSETIHSWHGLNLRADDVILPDGQMIKYSYIDHPGSVVIVPLFSDHEVIVSEQYRYPIKSKSIEFPAGGVEQNESSEEAAHREMMEEIRYRANKMTYLGSFFSSNSGSNEKVYVYLATELSPVDEDVSRDEAYEIKYRKIGFSKLIAYILEGLVTDGFTIAAAFFLQENLRMSD